jgi:hydrogenase/urease accessory protein HupE
MTHKLRLFLCFMLMLAPGSAFAHTPIKGINNFYNGVLHPLLVPSHLLLLMAIGLFLGQRGMKEIQQAIMAFMAATLLGLVGAWFSPGAPLEIIMLSSSAIMGLLIALSPNLSVLWCSVIAAICGLLLGVDSTQETLTGEAKFVALFGSGVGIYFFSLYPMALADFFKKVHWKRIIIRVMGSWLAASSFLVLALALRS